jgi:hypothetical protein
MPQRKRPQFAKASGPCRFLAICGGSASGGLPQFDEQEQGGDGGGKDEGEEEEVDEGVHARQWNTGGGTSAGGGQIFLRLKVEFEARVEGFPPADAAKSLRFPHSFL